MQYQKLFFDELYFKKNVYSSIVFAITSQAQSKTVPPLTVKK